MSNAVVWQVIRNQNSFLVKRDGGRTQLSGERGNLKNVNSFKSSGLANSKVVSLIPKKRKDGKQGASLALKKKKAAKSPGKGLTVSSLGTDIKRDFHRLSGGIRKQVRNYRPDLTQDALARWSKIHKVTKRTKAAPTAVAK